MSGVSAMIGALAAVAVPPLTVQCDPSEVEGFYDGELHFGITDATTARLTGGVSPFTYLWQKVSGASFTVLPNTAAATVRFRREDGQNVTAQYRVTVTDALNRTASALVSVSMS